MATQQSEHAKERMSVAVPMTAGIETVNIYDVDLSGGILAADILEVGLLPANARITGITVIGALTGTGQTADLGVMTGEWRDGNSVRTLATVLMNDVTVHNATVVGNVDALTDFATSGANRSIGMTFSANIAAGAGKSVKAIVRTIMA